MKRILISALVAAIIYFAYQSLSWTVLPNHKESVKYTPNQEVILKSLNENLAEEGYYSVPFWNEESGESMEDFNASMEGSPYAMISYHKSFKSNMGTGMGLGFLFNFLGLLMASILLFNLKPGLGFGSRWLITMCIAAIIFFMSLMTSWNWWATPWHFLKGEILDIVLGWGITGLWLAWYSSKKAI